MCSRPDEYYHVAAQILISPARNEVMHCGSVNGDNRDDDDDDDDPVIGLPSEYR